MISNHKIIKNVLNETEIELLSTTAKLFMRSAPLSKDYFDDLDIWFTGGSFRIYGHPIFDSLLITKAKIFQEASGKRLLPGYSYFRMYTKYQELYKHTDRPNCEYTISINIDSSEDKPWPIYIGEEPVILQKGDGVMYMGEKISHFRKPLDQDYSSQVFLHYVDANGPNTHLMLDERKVLGMYKDPTNSLVKL